MTESILCIKFLLLICICKIISWFLTILYMLLCFLRVNNYELPSVGGKWAVKLLLCSFFLHRTILKQNTHYYNFYFKITLRNDINAFCVIYCPPHANLNNHLFTFTNFLLCEYKHILLILWQWYYLQAYCY